MSTECLVGIAFRDTSNFDLEEVFIHHSSGLPRNVKFNNDTVIQLVSLQESGVLACTATNEFGTDYKSANVIVRHDSITSDQMFTVEPISPVPALNGSPTCQTVDDLPSSVESIWIRRLEQVHQRNEELALSSATVHASLPVPVPVPAQKQTCTQQPPKPSESLQKRRKQRGLQMMCMSCSVLF
ncbi:unnamed protein product [Mytilus edulis]|uniref:Uncharacterized protein n=1 Tax=Mytilus edulis TaxID=6550 RepID=A0A8S3U6F4_MYTED|nr:unnamed protein product [Mytilus edulis]